MKRTGLFFCGLLIAIWAGGQTITLRGGLSVSKLDWKLTGVNTGPLFNELMTGYSFFAGLNFLEKKHYLLSANIGMIRKGGRDNIIFVDAQGNPTGETTTVKPFLDYLSFNTTFDLNGRIKEQVSPFISLGPRFGYLVNSSSQFKGLKEINELNIISFGLILGGGLKYDMAAFQIGLRADYYFDFTRVACWTIEETGISGQITAKMFSVNLTVGYKIK